MKSVKINIVIRVEVAVTKMQIAGIRFVVTLGK